MDEESSGELDRKYVVARVSADGLNLEPMGSHGRINVYDSKEAAAGALNGLQSIFPSSEFVIAPASMFAVGIIAGEIKNG